MSQTEVDHTFPLEARRKAEDILVKNKATYFFQVFGSVQHGFALRADPSIPVQSKLSFRELYVCGNYAYRRLLTM